MGSWNVNGIKIDKNGKCSWKKKLGMELLNGLMGIESWSIFFSMPGVIDSNVT